jgi:competence protein ComEC
MHPLLRRMLRPGGLLLLNALLLAVISLASLPDGRLHLTMLDIGQGDAILVEAPSGATLLIDGGPDPDLTLGRLGEALPFYQRRIDVVLLTHPHQDHVAGLVEVLRRYDIGLVLDSGRAFENPSYARW